jgi:hypothetical protein
VLRKLRLYLEHRDGTLRRAVQVFFTARDASLYLVPYSRSGDYYCGRETARSGRYGVRVECLRGGLASSVGSRSGAGSL